MSDPALGIDIGGSGIKGGLVDLSTGLLVTERWREDTPVPATPSAVAAAVARVVGHFSYAGPVGVTYPGIIRNGVAKLAANVDSSFLGVDVDALFTEATGRDVYVMNDADAAGVAEMRFGAGRGTAGTVLLLAFGTGIGSALFRDGALVPNTELGHLELNGEEAERRASAKVRKRENLDWAEWCDRVNHYLAHVEMLFSPDVLIFGGGVSKRWETFGHLLVTTAELRPAALQNNAGIAGAAMMATEA